MKDPGTASSPPAGPGGGRIAGSSKHTGAKVCHLLLNAHSGGPPGSPSPRLTRLCLRPHTCVSTEVPKSIVTVLPPRAHVLREGDLGADEVVWQRRSLAGQGRDKNATLWRACWDGLRRHTARLSPRGTAQSTKSWTHTLHFLAEAGIVSTIITKHRYRGQVVDSQRLVGGTVKGSKR